MADEPERIRRAIESAMLMMGILTTLVFPGLGLVGALVAAEMFKDIHGGD